MIDPTGNLHLQAPEKLGFLYQPAPYKVLYGGRGGGKSENMADALIVLGSMSTMRVLCARELQNSLAESVHAVLKNSIAKFGLDHEYVIQEAIIFNKKTGTEFIFAGIRRDISKIKSMFGITHCWVEEAANVSKHSWQTLLPTIRKDDAEIWISFNPELDTDETYKRFVLNPPSNAVVVKVNWRDNPWFPEILKKQKDDLAARDYDSYLNVWEGHCKQTIDGAVYANEIREATKDGRICRVPIVPGKPVDTFWDLGKRDHTALWFVQFSQGEYRVIDFYQNRGEELSHYFKVMQERSYVYGMHFLPHDASADRLGSVAIDKQFKALYPGKVKVLPRISNIGAGIGAVRELFPLCYFDESKCADGLQALRRYKYDVDPNTGNYSKHPLHDENSDAADAFRQIAQAMNMHQPKESPKTLLLSKHGGSSHGTGWLGN